MLEIKGQVWHRVCLHVKIPGWMLNLNALLTENLPKLLSRLSEMSGGRENTCLVSGSLWRILKFLRMAFFIARFCGWEVRVNGILLVSLFCEVWSAVSRSISRAWCLPVVTVESEKPRFPKNWYISSHMLFKSVSPLQRCLSLRN